jgi:hypothetical protein
LISQEISGLILKIFLEIDALNKAVSEAALFSGKEVSCLKREEAILCALSKSRSG